MEYAFLYEESSSKIEFELWQYILLFIRETTTSLTKEVLHLETQGNLCLNLPQFQQPDGIYSSYIVQHA